jgi:2-dehydro-3-deoxyglucarate aldolase/4-hydroxy-2-oxoheptanedioate aldolase
VETPEAVANLDEILAVPGLDGIFIGPMDLSTSMGHFADPSQPDVQAAIATIEAKVLGAGKFLATVAGTWAQAHKLYGRGYGLLLVLADGTALAGLAAERVAQFRTEYPEG